MNGYSQGGRTLNGLNDLDAQNISCDNLTVSGDVNIASGSSYKINGSSVLNASTLGASVLNSSLTSVGTLSTLTVSGDVNIDSNTIKVDSANNRVGIVKPSPAYPLDIVGDVNYTGNMRRNTYRKVASVWPLQSGPYSNGNTLAVFGAISNVDNLVSIASGTFGVPQAGVYKIDIILNYSINYNSNVDIQLFTGTSSASTPNGRYAFGNGWASGSSGATTIFSTFLYDTSAFSNELFFRFVVGTPSNITFDTDSPQQWSRIHIYEL